MNSSRKVALYNWTNEDLLAVVDHDLIKRGLNVCLSSNLFNDQEYLDTWHPPTIHSTIREIVDAPFTEKHRRLYLDVPLSSLVIAEDPQKYPDDPSCEDLKRDYQEREDLVASFSASYAAISSSR